MAIEVTGTPATTASIAVNKVAPQNQNDLRVHSSSSDDRVNQDRVSFTPVAEQLRRTEDNGGKQPVVDKKRVEAIREKMANGTYHVNASRLADKLLNFEDSLNGGAPH